MASTLTLVSCNTEKDVCKFFGHLDGVSSDSIMIYVYNDTYDDTEYIDTIAMTKGAFEFSVKSEFMRDIYIVPITKDQYNSIHIPAIPGEEAIINGTANGYDVSGSKFYEILGEYENICKPINEKMDSLNQAYSDRLKAGEDKQVIREELIPLMNDARKEIKVLATEFVKANPKSHVAGYLLSILGEEERAMCQEVVSKEVLEGPTAPALVAKMKREADAKVRRENAKKINPNAPAPDFTLNDLDGNPLALSSIKDKYIVLDFWGSWCGWCIKGLPYMKEYYAKYKDNIEILSIDCNESDEKWRKGVAQYELPWLNVRNTENDRVNIIYGISGYPTKVLINPNMTINKVFVGESEDFYKYLDEIFQK